MRFLFFVAGAFVAAAFLAGSQQTQWGHYLVPVPFILLYPLYVFHPVLGISFAFVYGIGLVSGKYLLGWYPQYWAWPEAVVAVSLVGVPLLFDRLAKRQQDQFDQAYGRKKAEKEGLQRTSQSLHQENDRIELQIRDIGHLYDVMRDAGSTLSVQEMLALAREHTERMFDLSHFVMAMLSDDGKRYEIKISSGCDESRFKDFAVDMDPGRLAAHLAKDRRTIWVEDTGERPEFSRIADLSIRSFAFIPFIVQNQVIGFFASFASGEEDFLDAEKFTNLQIFFNQISIGLQKALLYEKVQRLSVTDGLTRLFSHRHFRQRLDEELDLTKRYASHMALLMLDIDHFKRYNDTYGHIAGDQVLMATARILKETCDATQLVARYGGEEMVVMLPEADQEQGIALAEKIRTRIESNVYNVGKEQTRVTVSIGVASYPQDAANATSLISQADTALYAAKEGGRNRVVGFTPGLRTLEKKIDTPGGER